MSTLRWISHRRHSRIEPYYGAKAGNQLTALLKTHITDAVSLVSAAKIR